MRVTTTDALIDELRAILPAELAAFSRGLSSAPPDASLRLDDLLSPPHRQAIMSYLEARLGARPDWRAAFSIWAGWHFRSILPPLIAANVLLDVSPRLDVDEIRFVSTADLRVDGIAVPASLEDVSGSRGPARFAGLVDGYLTPLIAHIAERTHITKRVLWSNAGHDFEGFLRMLEPVARGRAALDAAGQLLTTRCWPNGDVNPVFEPVRYTTGRRIRRVCCMRYLFPDGRTCGACPLDVLKPKSG